MEDPSELKDLIAQACRVLARKGLVEGILGHVSARLPGCDEILIRSRGPMERGLANSTPEDVRPMTTNGQILGDSNGWRPPSEYPIHTVIYRARPEVGAVVHAHPPNALLCGLAGLTPRPVIGAYNASALHLAEKGIPVFSRPVLISRSDLADQMLDAMGTSDVCLLRGHGITAVGATVQQATLRAINLEALCEITVELARLGATVPEISAADLAELPDHSSQLNAEITWNALLAS